MQNEDLDRFAELALDLPSATKMQTVSDLLFRPDGELRVSDVWHLRKSAECAVHAGQMDHDVFAIFYCLWGALRKESANARLVGLDHAEAWRPAMAIALANPDYAPREPMDKSRQQVVGEACKRLTSRGRKLRICAHGPDWCEVSLWQACASIDYLVSRLGGQAVLDLCGNAIQQMNRTFGEIWLLGDQGLGSGREKVAAVPFGWLSGLAARHMHRPNTCHNPTIAWRSLITQASDVAATFDCQRYGQFEDIGGISSSQIDEKISEAMGWRLLFFTPQAPRLLLPRLQAAFRKELPTDTNRDLRSLVTTLFNEMIDLAEYLRSDGCMVIKKSDARRKYPQLCEHALAPFGSVNRHYHVPVRGAARADTAFVLFDGPNDTFVIRPVAMSVHAFCEALFTLVWRRLGKPAEKIVGNVIESAIVAACQGKADRVSAGEFYRNKKNREEIDVAARSGNQVTLIEAKAKVLTRGGQIGTSGKFYDDYAKSYLKLVRQLARHDHDLRKGATDIAEAYESASLEVERIAVSTVSFGPIADRLTTTALMSALPSVELHALDNDPKAHESVTSFNDEVRKTVKELEKAVPKDAEGRHDLHQFVLFTQWLDLGQLLFALDRTDQVSDALRPVRYLTTGSRDFWTEFAFAQSIGSS